MKTSVMFYPNFVSNGPSNDTCCLSLKTGKHC